MPDLHLRGFLMASRGQVTPASAASESRASVGDERAGKTSPDPLAPEPAVLTVQQAAALLQVSENHLYSLIAQRAVPHVRLGKLIRIPRWGLMQQIAAQSSAPLVNGDAVAFPAPQSVHVHQPAKEGD
jgi:excisionase family DNA binding protein